MNVFQLFNNRVLTRYLFVACLFISSLTFSETINYFVTDTVYVGVNGEFNYNESDYLADFQSQNNTITSITSSDSPLLNCDNLGIQILDFVLTDGTLFIDGQLTVTFLDTIAPVTVLNPNQTIYLDENGVAEVEWATINASSHDNCNFTESFTPTSFDCSTTGLQTVTVTLEDASGNTTSADVQVNIVDNTAPVIEVNTMIAYLDSFGVARISVLDFDNGTVDNCNNNFDFSISDSIFDNTEIGMNNVVFTAQNDLGETSTLNVQVEVKDTMAPFISTQNLQLPIGANGELNITASMFNNGTSDNSLVVTTALNKTFFVCTDVGFHTLIFTATDNYNNSSTKEVTLEIIDNIDPIAISHNVTLILDAAGNAILDPADLDNGSTDNCELSFSASKTVFNCDDIGSSNVFLTVSDGSSNTAIATAVVTVQDNTGPVAQVQTVTLELNEFGSIELNPQDIDDNSNDNCSEIVEYTASQILFTCDDLGANTVLFGIEDEQGNTSSLNTTVIIEDNLPPVAILQDFTVSLDTNGEYHVLVSDIDAGSSDNCSGGLTFTFSDTLLNINDIGDNTINVVISDENGNSTTGDDIVITVNDNMDPVLELPIEDIIAYTQPNFCGTPVVFPTPVFTDNSGSFTVTYSHASSSVFTLGQTEVSYMAIDPSGNTKTDTFLVTVIDNVAPEVISSIENYTHNELGIVTWDESQLVFSDNCSGILNYSLSHNSLDTFPIGITTVSGVVTDANNNNTTFSFEIDVKDLIDPEFNVVPNDFDVYLTAGCQTPIEYDSVQASDNNSDLTITYSIPTGTVLGVGDHDILVTATDSSGNSAEHEFTISILDTVAPSIIAVQDDIVVGLCDNNVSYTLPDVEDNCEVSSLVRVTGLPSGSIFSVGEHTIIYLAKDPSGNTTEISFTITVHDSELPYFQSVRVGCSSFEPFDLTNGVSNIEFSGDGVYDNMFHPDSTTAGIHQISYAWTDDYGCVKTGNVEVILNDSPPMPEIVQTDVLTLSVHNAYNTYQWYRNGDPIPGATYINLNITDGGNYEVVCGNESNCFSTSMIFNIGGGIYPSLNIEELNKNGIVLFPNPTENEVTITSKFSLSSTDFQLTDMIGNQYGVESVQYLNAYQTKINIENLPNGLYLLSVSTEKGMITKKILKK